MPKRRPDRRSIKEAADTLNAGICYFTSSGIVKLCNRQMARLYDAMAHSDLQTLSELHQALAQWDTLPGREDVFLLPDGSAWKYTESAVTARDGNTYTETLFSNVTELYRKQQELEGQIRELRQMAEKLRMLSENAVAAAREQEILAAKTKLHAQMGENLTVMRQALLIPEEKTAWDAAAQAMLRTVHGLMAESEEADGDAAFREFLTTAQRCGVTVSIDGNLPGDRRVRQVFVTAMRECLTNSVRHGEADALNILLSRERGHFLCAISNNGTAPDRDITPQGGLKNLQRHVANCGGTLAICCKPVFTLTITIPQRKEETP